MDRLNVKTLMMKLALLAIFATSPFLEAQQAPVFVNPPSVTSTDGVLNTTLTVGPATTTVAGVQFQTNLYNNLYAPPVLRVWPGDKIQLDLTNNISSNDITNLHYHGFAVSPLSPSDNIFLSIESGENFNYTVNVPANHAQGLFWYHPHPHGLSENQVLGGLSGVMIVEGLLQNNYPQLVGIAEKIMLLKDINIDASDKSNPHLNLPPSSPCFPGPLSPLPKAKTVNGLCNPTLNIAPNEIQLWRIANIGADAYFNLSLPGIQMYVIAVDGNATVQPILMTHYLLPPGARVEVLIVGGNPGTYQISSANYDTGPAGDLNPTVPLLTLVTGGQVVNPSRHAALKSRAAGRGTVFPTLEQVLKSTITGQRTFTFSENVAGTKFCINNCQSDMNRVDTTVNLGDTEIWTLVNTSQEAHAFHIHQLDFAVIEVNGVPQNPTGIQDTVNLPFQTAAGPGVVKVIVPFLDPNIIGEFVYHCHILEHEDAGMMANILVLPELKKERQKILRLVRAQTQHHAHGEKKVQACIPCE